MREATVRASYQLDGDLITSVRALKEVLRAGAAFRGRGDDAVTVATCEEGYLLTDRSMCPRSPRGVGPGPMVYLLTATGERRTTVALSTVLPARLVAKWFFTRLITSTFAKRMDLTAKNLATINANGPGAEGAIGKALRQLHDGKPLL